jgi:hypothetical protein
MPISKKGDSWYWGSQGPFETKKKAEEVQRAAHASGYKKTIQKISTGARQEGPRPNIPTSPKGLKHLFKQHMYFQAEVDYRMATHDEYARNEKCESCFFWKDNGACHIVYGNIDPYMWCERWQPSPLLQKEDGGGALAGGGTVFTSTNSGIFTPTYGGNGRKKKKKSGIERLAQFINNNSPQKKMEKQLGPMSGGSEFDALHRAGTKDMLERDEEKNEPEVVMIEENKKKK